MSKEKITSKIALNAEAISSTENPNTKTEPMQTQSTGFVPEEPEISSERSIKEYSSGPNHRLSINVDMSADSIRYSVSLFQMDRIQEEESTEQFCNEMESEYETDEDDYTATKQPLLLGNVKDITDPKDPQAILLQTDTQTLHLSKLPLLPPAVPESSQDRIFGVDSWSSKSSGLSSSVHTFVGVESQPVDFFESLGEVPDMTDISSISEIQVVQRVPSIPKIPHVGGHFVDPLTGSTLKIETKVAKEAQVVVETETLEKEEESTEEEPCSDESLFEDFDEKYPEDPEEKIVAKEEEQEDFLDTFITKNQAEGKIEFLPAVDEEDEEKLIQQEMLVAQVDKFFDELLKEVVRFVDKNRSQTIFRANLDKKKLFMKIERIIPELISETRARDFVDRKAAEYYRRRYLTRYISAEKSDNRSYEFEKYKEASQHLDKLLGQETFMIAKTTSKIVELEKLKEELEKSEGVANAKFENLLRNTLKRDGMPHLEEVVEQNLRKMKELADQITEVRVTVIQRQHAVATLKAKIEELENIGSGLRVADYESIQRQSVAVCKKVEERNRDLEKFRESFHSSLHVLAHSKLRNEVLVKRMAIKEKKLEIFAQEKALCRTVVYELKKQRQKVQRQISDLSHQSGLLDKPILLRDYDDTVELIEKKRKVVEELRQTHKKLEHKLKLLEKACSTK